MKYRALGRTKLSVSEIGFGCWGIGGLTSASYGETYDNESIAALHKARDLGVTLYDTAPAYGRSEDLIGKAFNGSPDVVLATKVGYLAWDSRPDFTINGIVTSINKSLKRLRSDRIDLLLLHGAPPAVLDTDEIHEILSSLTEAGKIRYWGISAKSPSDALEVLKSHNVSVIQANFNMMDTRVITSGLFEEIARRGIGFVGRTPLCFGFLAGKITKETTYPHGDHRLNWSRAQLENWIDGSTELLREVDVELAALRYCLSFPEVTSIIPGAMKASEVLENVRASDLGPLSKDLLKKVLEINEQRRFIVKK